MIAEVLRDESNCGIARSDLFSPLFANILLDELDTELEKRVNKLVRYADDFIIRVKSKRSGERVFSNGWKNGQLLWCGGLIIVRGFS